MELATSTIAMSAYNLLTLAPSEVTVGELYGAVCHGHGVQLDRPQFVVAVKEMLRRGLVHLHRADDEHPQDRVSCRDPRRRRVRWRDRTGDGWGNWLVEDPRGPQRLEDVINGIH